MNPRKASNMEYINHELYWEFKTLFTYGITEYTIRLKVTVKKNHWTLNFWDNQLSKLKAVKNNFKTTLQLKKQN